MLAIIFIGTVAIGIDHDRFIPIDFDFRFIAIVKTSHDPAAKADDYQELI